MVIGGSSSDRSNPAWQQVYRSLEHSLVKKACQNNEVMKKFPKEIEDFGNTFRELQQKRHKADYDLNSRYYKSDVASVIERAEDVIVRFNKVPRKHRRAFAAFVLLKARRE